MKKTFLFLLLLSSVFVNAQSVKDALFSGKLKNENGTVIKKGDDLTTKIDTTTRKLTDSTKAIAATKTDSVNKKNVAQFDSTSAIAIDKKDNVADNEEGATIQTGTVEAIKETVAPKDNNILWKDFVNTITATLQTEVLTSKKIKNGTYYVTVSYVIETDGQVGINNVSLTPENSFLQQQIKDRLSIDTPKLNPVLNSAGAPRKVNKNYNFQITKD